MDGHFGELTAVYISQIPENLELKPLACRERETELNNTKNEKLKAARYLDWQVLMYAAEHTLGIRTDELHFTKDSKGKWSCDGFFFSLSHTDGAVCAAVSRNNRVGVDIENRSVFDKKAGADEKRKKLFDRMATPNEAEAFSDAEVLPLWLKKESIFKCFDCITSVMEADTTKYAAEVYKLSSLPDFMLAVCGEKPQKLRFFLYENDSAAEVTAEKNC